MDNELSKLQIRAKVLSVVSDIKTKQHISPEEYDLYVKELKQIADYKSVYEILIKELVKYSEPVTIVLGCIISEVVPTEYIKEKTFEYLSSNNYSDSVKYKILQVLKITGVSLDYGSLPEYFENPKEILDEDTKKLLKKATIDPEAMLDFLDFISALPMNDKFALINSLATDYKGDELANIIYPILYSDFDREVVLRAIEILGDSSSALGIEPLTYLMYSNSDDDIKSACKKNLAKLKLAGATPAQATSFFLSALSKSKPSKIYATLPDGAGNQGIIVTRVKATGNCLMYAVVINDILGVVDAFGFSDMTQSELVRVITRFYKSEGKYNITREYARTILDKAIETTINNDKKFPYEFVCWDVMTKDFDTLNEPVETFVENEVKHIEFSLDEALQFFTSQYVLRWFMTVNETERFNNLMTQFISDSEISVDKMEVWLREHVKDFWDDDFSAVWRKRIINSIYIISHNDKKEDAEKLYAIINNEKLFLNFKYVMLQRSIYTYFITMLENIKSKKDITNIFLKNKQKIDYPLNEKQLKDLLKDIETKWLGE